MYHYAPSYETIPLAAPLLPSCTHYPYCAATNTESTALAALSEPPASFGADAVAASSGFDAPAPSWGGADESAPPGSAGAGFAPAASLGTLARARTRPRTPLVTSVGVGKPPATPSSVTPTQWATQSIIRFVCEPRVYELHARRRFATEKAPLRDGRRANPTCASSLQDAASRGLSERCRNAAIFLLGITYRGRDIRTTPIDAVKRALIMTQPHGLG